MKTGISKGYERLCKGFCERVSQKKREEKVYPTLRHAGLKEDFDVWLGKRMVLVLLAFTIGMLLPTAAAPYIEIFRLAEIGLMLAVSIGAGLALAGIAAIIIYLHTYYIVEGRASMVEAILPDFMLLVASNINAGMTPFSAFRAGARKEFGPLSEEIKLATTKSLGTKSFTSTLKELSKNIRSKILEETVSFFTQAMKSGGQLAKLLETSALDLKQTQEMKKELVSSTRMYVIFVAFVIVIAAPLLLAVSIQFLNMISSIQAESQIGIEEELGSVAFLSAELRISPDFMLNVSYLLLVGNALLAAMFIGVLSEGKAKMGLRYAPVVFIASLIALVASNILLKQFLMG